MEFAINGVDWHESTQECCQACCKVITNVLKKYSFCNLENLNILVYDWVIRDDIYATDENNFFYTQFFDILSNNKECIDNQFEQFNVGYKIIREEPDAKVYYTFSWHGKMSDDKIFGHTLQIWRLVVCRKLLVHML